MRRYLPLFIIVVGILLMAPFWNIQPMLSQGDHGRDLYAGQAVLRGELPYHDFWWVYGPLMPYVYSLFYKVLGVSITSLIICKLAFKILAGLMLFLGLRYVISIPSAVMAGFWFILFGQDFFFTYNHSAGIAFSMMALWGALAYLRNANQIRITLALIACAITCLIKVNFGLTALAMVLFTVFISDHFVHQRPFKNSLSLYVTGALILPIVIIAIYLFFLHGLNLTEIRQCLPYYGDDQPYNSPALVNLKNFIRITYHNAKSNMFNLTLMFLIIPNVGLALIGLLRRGWTGKENTTRLFGFFLISLWYVLNMHEFIKSGVWYRCFWAQPLSIALMFLCIDTAGFVITRWGRNLVLIIFACIGFWVWTISVHNLNYYKNSPTLPLEHAQRVYIGNQPSWSQTIIETTHWLKTNLKNNELFLALPYDCIYYFLTDKRSPTRQLIFFEHIKITQDQERSIIKELEHNQVNYVLISSRAWAKQELGLGLLGKTYCPIIGKYIQSHFEPVTRFGDWTNEPGWAWNHGTMILKRKN